MTNKWKTRAKRARIKLLRQWYWWMSAPFPTYMQDLWVCIRNRENRRDFWPVALMPVRRWLGLPFWWRSHG